MKKFKFFTAMFLVCITAASLLAGPLAGTASAVVADRGINAHLAVCPDSGCHGAGLLYAALAAATALVSRERRHPLTHNTQVIEVRLDAVIRAAADGDLKFMRQCNMTVAFIESPENLF